MVKGGFVFSEFFFWPFICKSCYSASPLTSDTDRSLVSVSISLLDVPCRLRLKTSFASGPSVYLCDNQSSFGTPKVGQWWTLSCICLPRWVFVLKLNLSGLGSIPNFDGNEQHVSRKTHNIFVLCWNLEKYYINRLRLSLGQKRPYFIHSLFRNCCLLI